MPRCIIKSVMQALAELWGSRSWALCDMCTWWSLVDWIKQKLFDGEFHLPLNWSPWPTRHPQQCSMHFEGWWGLAGNGKLKSFDTLSKSAANPSGIYITKLPCDQIFMNSWIGPSNVNPSSHNQQWCFCVHTRSAGLTIKECFNNMLTTCSRSKFLSACQRFG